METILLLSILFHLECGLKLQLIHNINEIFYTHFLKYAQFSFTFRLEIDVLFRNELHSGFASSAMIKHEKPFEDFAHYKI